jgi:hypothetical protein
MMSRLTAAFSRDSNAKLRLACAPSVIIAEQH